MKAMILAAGMGTRLGKLTENKPKALVEINGVAMLESLILRLKAKGIKQYMVNVHHFGEQVIDFLHKNKNFGTDISISDEREELLDTGGAIKKAAAFFNGTEPVLVHNVDVYSEIDLEAMLDFHLKMQAFATICVRRRKSSRVLIFNSKNQLTGWVNLDENQFKWVEKQTASYQTYAYNGIFIASPGFAAQIPFSGRFSIIDCWLKMAKTNKIEAYLDESPAWFDLGSEEKITAAEQFLTSKKEE